MDIEIETTASPNKGLFGLESSLEKASVVCIPVPWDVTSSYGEGAHQGPELILQASPQIDLFDEDRGAIYKRGIFMLPIDKELQKKNSFYRSKALELMKRVKERASLDESHHQLCKELNLACEEVHQKVYQKAKSLLERKKACCLLGGDHSTALGLIQAVGERCQGDFSLLQIDAHADLRPAYQGLTYSHASIMFNVLESTFAPQSLLQVGLRDFSEGEWRRIQEEEGKGLIHCFSNQQLQRRLFHGESWSSLCEDMVERLGSQVYVSFDVDGLKPYLCPQTGTPVPGGLELEQVFFFTA